MRMVVCRYAALVMPVCAAPSLLLSLWARSAGPEQLLTLVWAGLMSFMAMRAMSIWLPFRNRALMFGAVSH